MEYKTIGGILMLVLIAGGMTVYISENGKRDLCTDSGIWEYQEDTGQYYCPTENSYKWCFRVSDSGRTCYLGNVEEIEPEPPVEPQVPGRPPTPVSIFANGENWDCTGTNQYSRCWAGKKEGYYGEFVKGE